MSPCPPCSANTDENSAEPTNSQHTIAVVLAVRKVDSLRFRRSSGETRRYQSPGTTVPRNVPPIAPATASEAQGSCFHRRARTPRGRPARLHHHTARAYRAITARYIAPSAPMAADSVAVQMPNRITASTTTVSTPSGTTEATSSRRISSCSPSMRE